MRLTVFLILFPGAALAHVGHLGEYAGHDHWIAGTAIGIAVTLGLWAAWKGKRDDDAAPDPDADSQAEDEAKA